jgi:hypothetical protein
VTKKEFEEALPPWVKFLRSLKKKGVKRGPWNRALPYPEEEYHPKG